jgi:hypothetical protein
MEPLIFPTPQWISLPGNEVNQVDDHSQGGLTGNKVVLLDAPEVQAWIAEHSIPLQEGIFQPGGYLVDIRREGTLAAGFDQAGWFYAVQTLQRLYETGKLPALTVQDWPYKPIRGIHLYLPGREDIPFFNRLLSWLASLKYNTIFLEVSGGMRYKSHPEVNAGWEKFCREAEAYPGGPQALQATATRFIKDSTHTELGRGTCLEQAEVRDLVAFARGLFFEIVPEVQSLSHSYYLCCAHPEIAEQSEDPWPDTTCPSNPRSYEIYFDLLQEVIEVFQPRILHIGHDEIYTIGVCPRCREKSGSDLLEGDLLKIYGFLKDRGIRMALWGDSLLPFTLNGWEGGVARRVERENGAFADIPETWRAIERLPRDVLISEWQGNANPRAMQFFLMEGFEVYCGNFGDNFAAHSYPRWNERSVSPRVLGGEPSTWCQVSEFAFGYNGCLFNLAFSAELLWWSHYRDAERGRLANQEAGEMPRARRMLGGRNPLAEPPARDSHTSRQVQLPPSRVTRLPFAPRLEGIALNPDAPSALIAVGEKVMGLAFTHACMTELKREPTWALADPYRPPAACRLAVYQVVYQDGSLVEIPIDYGTHVTRWDIPYGEEIDAAPYQADPVRAGRALDSQPVTLYRVEWQNPRPEVAVQQVRVSYIGDPSSAVWITGCETR